MLTKFLYLPVKNIMFILIIMIVTDNKIKVGQR